MNLQACALTFGPVSCAPLTPESHGCHRGVTCLARACKRRRESIACESSSRLASTIRRDTRAQVSVLWPERVGSLEPTEAERLIGDLQLTCGSRVATPSFGKLRL